MLNGPTCARHEAAGKRLMGNLAIALFPHRNVPLSVCSRVARTSEGRLHDNVQKVARGAGVPVVAHLG